MKNLLLARVAHVTTAHQPTDNRIMRKECHSLAEAGIDICLVAVADQDETIDGVKIRALPRRGNRLMRMVLGPWDVWRMLRDIRPTLIHVHDPELIPMALVWRLRRGRRVIYDAHEDLPKQVMGKPYIHKHIRNTIAFFARALESAADRHLDTVVAATPSIARNFTCAPVTLVQNFPWLRDFPPPMPHDLGGELSVVYIGGITPERGAQEMIQGVKGSKHRPSLLLAGPASAAMEHLMNEETENGVHYLGFKAADAMPRILSQGLAGLVILHPLPNYLESQPTKIFEYMAAGRPFVASNFESWKNLLGEFDCGLFIDPLEPQALSDALDFLIEHPASAQEMGRRGRRALETSFTFEKEAERLIQATLGLLRGVQDTRAPGSPDGEPS